MREEWKSLVILVTILAVDASRDKILETAEKELIALYLTCNGRIIFCCHH